MFCKKKSFWQRFTCTVPNGNTNCEATDKYNLSDLGDCAGSVFDFDKPIDGTLTLSEDIKGKLRIYVIQ